MAPVACEASGVYRLNLLQRRAAYFVEAAAAQSSAKVTASCAALRWTVNRAQIARGTEHDVRGPSSIAAARSGVANRSQLPKLT